MGMNYETSYVAFHRMELTVIYGVEIAVQDIEYNYSDKVLILV